MFTLVTYRTRLRVTKYESKLRYKEIYVSDKDYGAISLKFTLQLKNNGVIDAKKCGKQTSYDVTTSDYDVRLCFY